MKKNLIFMCLAVYEQTKNTNLILNFNISNEFDTEDFVIENSWFKELYTNSEINLDITNIIETYEKYKKMDKNDVYMNCSLLQEYLKDNAIKSNFKRNIDEYIKQGILIFLTKFSENNLNDTTYKSVMAYMRNACNNFVKPSNIKEKGNEFFTNESGELYRKEFTLNNIINIIKVNSQIPKILSDEDFFIYFLDTAKMADEYLSYSGSKKYLNSCLNIYQTVILSEIQSYINLITGNNINIYNENFMNLNVYEVSKNAKYGWDSYNNNLKIEELNVYNNRGNISEISSKYDLILNAQKILYLLREQIYRLQRIPELYEFISYVNVYINDLSDNDISNLYKVFLLCIYLDGQLQGSNFTIFDICGSALRTGQTQHFNNLKDLILEYDNPYYLLEKRYYTNEEIQLNILKENVNKFIKDINSNRNIINEIKVLEDKKSSDINVIINNIINVLKGIFKEKYLSIIKDKDIEIIINMYNLSFLNEVPNNLKKYLLDRKLSLFNDEDTLNNYKQEFHKIKEYFNYINNIETSNSGLLISICLIISKILIQMLIILQDEKNNNIKNSFPFLSSINLKLGNYEFGTIENMVKNNRSLLVMILYTLNLNRVEKTVVEINLGLGKLFETIEYNIYRPIQEMLDKYKKENELDNFINEDFIVNVVNNDYMTKIVNILENKHEENSNLVIDKGMSYKDILVKTGSCVALTDKKYIIYKNKLYYI